MTENGKWKPWRARLNDRQTIPGKDGNIANMLLCLKVSGNRHGKRKLGFGGDEGDRTPDLSIANAALSQLSYIPTT